MMGVAKKSGPSKTGGKEPWKVRLYVAGWTPASVSALRNIKVLEAESLPPGSTVEVVDLLKDPEAGRRDHIVAIPTAVRISPAPVRRIIGDMTDMSKTLAILGLNVRASS